MYECFVFFEANKKSNVFFVLNEIIKVSLQFILHAMKSRHSISVALQLHNYRQYLLWHGNKH